MPLRRSWIYDNIQIELILSPRQRLFPENELRASVNTRIGGRRGSGTEYRMCYNCGERGHLQRWCPWSGENHRPVEPIRGHEQWEYDPDTGRWGAILRLELWRRLKSGWMTIVSQTRM
ncbi:unnamed protein product [Gordionus sp. m RMFG-2023]